MSGPPRRRNLTAVDLFAGAGGATEGLRQAGFRVLGAVENETYAAATYEKNHRKTKLIKDDIRAVNPEDFRRLLRLRKGELTLLKACPPCQGYSSLSRNDDDPRNDLVTQVSRFVRAFKPRVVLVENVPRLQEDYRLQKLRRVLASYGYSSCALVVDARDFGVPQRRRRFILIAARGRAAMKLPVDPRQQLRRFASFGPNLRTLFETAAALVDDDLQIERERSRKVLERIELIPIGGDRRDLPRRFVLPCHRRSGDNVATASYGRIRIDEDAPTMTTRCTSPSCGAFLHPTEDRAINLREASMIQTFPVDYHFVGPHSRVERMIGNAVPVRMARGLGVIVASLT